MNQRTQTPKGLPYVALLRLVFFSALICLFLLLVDELPARASKNPPRSKPIMRLSIEAREKIIARNLTGYSAALNKTLAAFRVPTETAAERLRELKKTLAAKAPDAKRIAELKKALAADRALLAALKTRSQALAALDSVTGFVVSGRTDGPFATMKKQNLIEPVRYIDTNADGLLDIVTAATYQGVRVWLADAQGGWTLSAPKHPEHEYLFNSRLADLNADGQIDIVGLYSKSGVVVHLADGKRGWISPKIDPSLKDNNFSSIALADFDGDKKTDIAVLYAIGKRGRIAAGIGIYRGLGNGSFQKWGIPSIVNVEKDFITYSGMGLSVADLNTDGNADLVIMHDGTVGDQHDLDAIWFGDGKGRFCRASVGLSFGRLPWETFACAEAADVNGDGKVDLGLCCSALDENMPHGVQICLGSGHGVWRAANTGLPPDPTLDLKFADIDGDGNIDIITAADDRIIVALGDGTGVWRMLPPIPVQDRREHLRGITVADIDGDGRKDIIAVIAGSKKIGQFHMEYFSTGSKMSFDSRIALWLNRPAGIAAVERINAVDAEIAAAGIVSASTASAPVIPQMPTLPTTAAPKTNIDEMLAMLGSRYYDDRLNASIALIEAGERALPKIRKGLEHPKPNVRAVCLDLLAVLGDSGEFPRIANIALDKKETSLVRSHALRTIELLDPFGKRTKALGAGLALQIAAATKQNDPDGKWKYEIEGILLPMFINYGVIDSKEYQKRVSAIKRNIRNNLARNEIKEALTRCHKMFKFPHGLLVKSRYDASMLVERPADSEIEKIVTDNLESYRKLYDNAAEKKFARVFFARSFEALGAFLWEYSFTTVAPKALDGLIAAEYERCAYLKVVMDWRRYPWLHTSASLTTRLLVLASLLQFGLEDEARAFAAAIVAANPDARIRVMNTETDVASYVESLFKNSGEAARAAAQPDPGSVGNPYPAPKIPNPAASRPLWARHFGVLYGNTSAYDLGNKTFVPWDKEAQGNTKKKGDYFFSRHGKRPAGAYPYFAVSDGENVIFNNGISVWCVSAGDGKRLWRYDNPVDSVDMLHKLRSVPLVRSVKYPYSVVVPSRGVVYVVMENYDSMEEVLKKFPPPEKPEDPKKQKEYLEKQKAYFKKLRSTRNNGVTTGSTVICLDLATGKRLWSSIANFGNFGKAHVRSPLRFADGRVLFTSSSDTITGGIHGITFELVALDADTGRLAWSKSVGDWRANLAVISARFSMSSGQYYYDMIAPPPMVVSGNAIIETGGMLASISVADGRVNWITRFRESPMVREKSMNSRTGRFVSGGKSVAATETTLVRPPLVCGDKIYIMPNGSEHLMAYDLLGGRLLWMRRVASSRAGKMSTWTPTFIKRDYSDMLAGPDGTVCLLGPAGLALVDTDGAVLWRNTEIIPEGLPVIASDCVAVPLAGGVVAYVSLKDGRRIGTTRLDMENLLKSRALELMKALAGAPAIDERSDDWLELMGICTESSVIVEQVAAEQKNAKRRAKFDAIIARLKLYFNRGAWAENRGRFIDPPEQKAPKPLGPFGLGSDTPKTFHTGGNLLLIGGRLYFATRNGFLIALAG